MSKKIFKIKIIAILIVSMVSCSKKLEALDLSPKHSYSFTSKVDWEDQEHVRSIESFYNSVKGKTFVGVDSVAVYYKVFKQPTESKGAIMIASGRTESLIKYKELIFDLYANGYSVYIHDHRGQGLSGRMTPDPEIGFVKHFQDYITDMKTFYTIEIEPNKHEQVYLLAHSMGGAIGFTYLQQFPNDFKAAAFSSPMFGLSFIQCSLGKALDKDKPVFAPTQKNYLESRETFEKNTLTNCETRYDIFTNAFMNEPTARLGGVSLHWLNESCNQFDVMFEGISMLETPSIVFSAEEEEIVDTKAHFKFVQEAKANNKQIKGYSVARAKHELFIEMDDVRESVLTAVLDFYKMNGNF